MAQIELDLSHSYVAHPKSDDDYALLPLQFTFRDGGAYALLGPSGCGKTTLLNCVSGLLRPSHGRILFDGQDFTDKTPQARNIAQVFQFPVVYDTMTVAENLAFPLRNRGVAPDRIRERVGRIAEMLEMSNVLDRRASGLTADAKQKISLGRGLVRSDVSAILFDEPLTVIDPQLKWELRRKLKEIHHEFKLTLIYVTHDQTEALTFADQVMVMARGRAVQVGSADDLFERPAHTFVGHFIGSPGMNFLPAQWRDGALRVGQHQLQGVPAELAVKLEGAGPVKLGVRPEYLRVTDPGTAGAVPMRVERVQDVGTYTLLVADFEGTPVRARLGSNVVAGGKDATVWLTVLNPHTCFYRDEELIR
ncbi:ABC transporter ATP-binding protein [Achromobacter animicus]|uniref:ABC transporter ATP-binding protein n=1 Tax=Achromobacter animicus TaxID=1389935 RepID=UPI00244C8D1A|nr:ABC transporter ATP-binding protein [Achromobacter animicus]MDH0684195.1 ABC transporter ATP-binding protein [Achromobacter animicus]